MKFQHTAKRIFSAALVFWMSGIVVLFCCGNMPAVKAASEESGHCPLAKKGDGASKTFAEVTDYSFNQESKAFDCCSFPARLFDKTRKIEKSPESAAVFEIIQVSAPQFYLAVKPAKSPQFYQSFVRNRGSTYLQNRVFRI